MDKSVAVTVGRYIVDLEERVHEQEAMVKLLVTAELDAAQATLTLRALERTLLLTREHLQFAYEMKWVNIRLSGRQQLHPLLKNTKHND